MDHLSGMQRVLAATPVWLTFAVLVFGAIGMVWILRRASAGEWYNVTYSGQIGDIALIILVIVGVIVLRGLDESPPQWLGGATSQWVWLTTCFAFSVFALNLTAHRPIWEEQAPEVLHAFVVIPALLFLVTTTLVVTVWTGAWKTLAFEAALIALWASLVFIDLKTGRADQVSYHTRTGEYFLFGW